jgi:hypothetical protein
MCILWAGRCDTRRNGLHYIKTGRGQAVQLLRSTDPVSAALLRQRIHKVYVMSQPNSRTTSSGMPKLQKSSLIRVSVPIVAAFLIQFVPMVRAGLIRSAYHLIDPVPTQIAMCEIQIEFLRKAGPETIETREYIRTLEAKITELRRQGDPRMRLPGCQGRSAVPRMFASAPPCVRFC